MRAIITYILLFFIIHNVSAQCGKDLINCAIQKSGDDAIFIRECNVKLEEGSISTPNPNVKYALLLNEDITYKITICSDSLQQGQTIVQLYNDKTMIAANYKETPLKTSDVFEVLIEETKSYILIVSMSDSYAGCAGIVVSLKPVFENKNDFVLIKNDSDVLYANVPNTIQLENKDFLKADYGVSIDKGIIEKRKSKYIITPPNVPFINVTVKSNGTDTISKSMAIQVTPVPDPNISLLNKTGGLIRKSELSRFIALQLTEKVENIGTYHRIVSFEISDKNHNSQGIKSEGAQFTHDQLSFLETLNSGDTFYIYNILVATTDGQLKTLLPLGFIIF